MKKNYLLLSLIFLLFNATVIKAQISGNVFRDYNADGTKQSTAAFAEPGLAGIIVNAYNASEALIASYKTTIGGNYAIPATGTFNGTIGSNTGSVANALAVRLEFIIPNAVAGGCLVDSTIDYSSSGGGTYGSSVRFVNGGATAINFAINNPADYVKNSPSSLLDTMFVTKFVGGNPTAGGTAGTANVLYKFGYGNKGNTVNAGIVEPPGAGALATNAQVGSIYGLGYSPYSNRLFAAAFMKRHVGFGPANGTFNNAPGAIYMVNPNLTTASPAASYFTSLDALGFPTHNSTGTPAYGSGTSYTTTVNGTNGYQARVNYLTNGLGVIGTNLNRGLPAASTTQSSDPAALGQIGKVSLGDLDVSEDGASLYTTNLFDRKLYKVTLNSATSPTAATAAVGFSLPNPPLRSTSGITGAAATYTGVNDNTNFYTGTRGIQRPFAVAINRGKVYVGAITTGEGTAGTTTTDDNTGNPEYTDLWAYVWEFDPKTNTFAANPVLQFPLNFNRGTNADGVNESWRVWRDTIPNPSSGVADVNLQFVQYPHPIFTDIVFDSSNVMVLGFRDRWGDLVGYDNNSINAAGRIAGQAFGDLYRAYYNPATCSFQLESNGKEGAASGKAATVGAANANGPGGGEFYYRDNPYDANDGTPNFTFHLNTTLGGLALVKGSDTTVTTTMDPIRAWSSGISWFSNTTGDNGRDYEMISGAGTSDFPAPPVGFFGKANGMGDLEMLNFNPPTEIGNRVWNDINGDGIQNPGEAGIGGVALEIFVDNNNDGVPDGAAIGTTTTATTGDIGSWYFNNSNITGDADPNTAGTQATLTKGVRYIVRPAAAAWASGVGAGALAGFKITKSNAIGSGQVDLSDNDASLIGATPIPQISIVAGTPGQNNHNLDFGFTRLASLGNRVWLDSNTDGLQNINEKGVAGVSVNLYQNGADGLPGTVDDVLVGSTTTDAYGNYLFENLTPSAGATTQYNVRVSAPANYSFTTQTNTTDDNLNTAPSTTGSDVNVLGLSYSIDLSSGENNLNIDAGLVFSSSATPNSIGDRVWFDSNGDGVQDAGEPGVAGITVTLYDDATGNIVAITTTDANGNYIFNNLPANTNYKVGFSVPAGTVLTTGGTLSTGNATTNSDANPTTGLTTTINTGAAGTQITGVDAGIKNDAKGALGDFVWNDVNRNGIQDAGEPGVPGVTMKLYGPGPDGLIGGGDDVLLSTTTTDANGYYVFPNLDPAKYFVVATPVAGYSLSPKDVTAGNPGGDTKDSDFGSGTAPYAGTYISPVKILLPTAGGVTRDMTVDVGIYNSATVNTLNTLGDRVWNDVNKDGLQTVGEAGVPNITVRLLTNVGAAVNNPATGKPYVVVTDANGNYKFVDLADGNYIVEFANIPVGYSFTGQDKDAANQGAPGSATDGTTDSDAKTTTGRTAVISVDAASASATSVNIVTVDAGVSQGVSAGTASLGNRVWYDINNNGLQDAGELGVNNVRVELLDGAGATVNVPTTAIPYVVYTNAQGEYLFTGLPAGDYTVRFSRLPAGFTSSTTNAGSDDAVDADASYAGAAVTATTTATTGIYTLQTGEDNLTVDMGIVPATGTNSLGNYVWSDLNADGKQTVGEPGVQGVMVTLYTNGADGLPGTADDVRVGVTTTDINGAYSFVGLADGNYNVGFTNLPAGYIYTDQNKAGSTGADGSDANTASGRTITYPLDPTSASATGVNDPNVDGGLISTRASLGNYVWLDSNGDGVQDASEKGISGVTVTLYDDLTSVVASTVTDAFGKYFFPNLNAGLYQVGFSTIPANLSFTKQNTPGDNGDDTNSDADPITGKTVVLNLIAGETDLTIDAGLKPNIDASVGNYVWNDLNSNGIQDATETGVPGVLVTLYDLSNNVIGTAVTDGNGNYLISKIPAVAAGTSYYIIFSNLPGTATFTTRTDNVTAGDATLGSDPNPSTGRTSNFTLTPGQYLPTVDAGITNVLILPVKITSFTALPKGSQVDLQWTLSEQSNVASYQVLYSTDGRNFNAAIATVSANSNISATYNAVHTTPVAGINYYRIKTIEKDGTISYSEIRKVTFGKSGTITVYPNPTVDKVNITFTGSMINKAATLSLLSADGKVLYQQKITSLGQTETLDVSRFANGTYIVRVVTSDEVINNTIQVVR